ncbi:MAG: hypothetical protein JST21_07775 [Bacteroidetes bacterium]|nr:hypothetical protein [Bacteroidota bacterium]
MTPLNIFLHYFGGVMMALLFLYGTRNYLISLIAGFIAFCVFYFSFGEADFEWQWKVIVESLKSGAIIYSISFVIGVVIYKLVHIEHFGEESHK